MSISLNDYRCKLVNKILFSTSREEVKRYITVAMKDLLQHRVNGHLIARFVESISNDLKLFNPMDYDSQQWANIKMARMQLNQIKQSSDSANQQKSC